ncbi:uncharacterized protein LOC144581531 [Callithrix jacchus]
MSAPKLAKDTKLSGSPLLWSQHTPFPGVGILPILPAPLPHGCLVYTALILEPIFNLPSKASCLSTDAVSCSTSAPHSSQCAWFTASAPHRPKKQVKSAPGPIPRLRLPSKGTTHFFPRLLDLETSRSGKAESLNLQNTHSPRLPSTVSYVKTANGLERPVSRLGSQRRHHFAGGRSRPALQHENLTLKTAEAGHWEGRGLGGAARNFRRQRTTRRPPPAPIALAQKPRDQSLHAPRVPVQKLGARAASLVPAGPGLRRSGGRLGKARSGSWAQQLFGPPAPRTSAGRAGRRWVAKGQDCGMPLLPERARPGVAFLALGESPGKARHRRARDSSLAAPLGPRAQEAGARYPRHAPRPPPFPSSGFGELLRVWPQAAAAPGSPEVAASTRRAPGSPTGPATLCPPAARPDRPPGLPQARREARVQPGSPSGSGRAPPPAARRGTRR